MDTQPEKEPETLEDRLYKRVAELETKLAWAQKQIQLYELTMQQDTDFITSIQEQQQSILTSIKDLRSEIEKKLNIPKS